MRENFEDAFPKKYGLPNMVPGILHLSHWVGIIAYGATLELIDGRSLVRI